MRKLIPFLLAFSTMPAMGANWYVSKAAAGTNAGTSWTNAWNELNQVNTATIACGDTVWIAGGTAYTTALPVSKVCTSGAKLTFNRVLATDSVPVAAAGWNPSFDATVNMPTFSVNGDYNVVSGRVAGGITITTSAGGGNTVTGATTRSILGDELHYIKGVGPACAPAGNCSTGAYGFNIAPSTNIVDGLIIDNCEAFNMSETVRTSNWQNTIIQNSSFHDISNDSVDHEDFIYSYTNGPAGNNTIRWNRFFNSPNDGVFFEFGGAVNLKIYRNYFYNASFSLMTFKNSGSNYGPVTIVNNTFVSNTGPCSSSCAFISGNNSTFTAAVNENNAFYYVTNSIPDSGGTVDHNAYSYTTYAGFPAPTGSGNLSFNPSTQQPFVNPTGGDAHLVSNSTVLHAAGVNLGAPYNVDMDGNTAPSAGAWDVGAFQFTSVQKWWVRPDGGTRWSASHTSGQCNGKFDVAYPGSGVNQNCAFGDVRWMYDAQDGSPRSWVMAGGDVLTIRGGPWRIGHDQGLVNADIWCNNGVDNNQTCYLPDPPAGTSGQHTIIQGEHFAACSDSSGVGPNTALLTELYGGFGLFHVVNLATTSFVDFKCLGVTRHSQCAQHGDPILPSVCSSNGNFPADDFAIDGLATFTGLHDVLFQDMWVHGFTNRGVIGPIGGTVTAERVRISYNGMAGWDFDDGAGDPSINNPTFNFLDSIIEWSGCNQEYPYTHPNPVSACSDQNNAGYGDGVGVPSGPLNVNVNHSISRYNTQDGMDYGHVDSGSSSMNISNSLFYGNMGSPFKWGFNFGTMNVVNNLSVDNCIRMIDPIPGTPSTFNAHLSLYCRSGAGFSFNFRAGQAAVVGNNTFIGYSPTRNTIGCSTSTSVGGCTTATLSWHNNVFLGFDDPRTTPFGGNGAPSMFFCQDLTLPGPPQVSCDTGFVTWNRSNNNYFGNRASTCPTAYANETCSTNTNFTNQPSGNSTTFVESELDLPDMGGTLSFIPAGGSGLIGSGVSYAGIPSADFSGAATTSPPVQGGLNFASTTPTVVTPAASPVAGTFTSTQSVTLSTSTGGAAICYTTNGSTPAATTPGACDAGSTTYSGAITVATTTTIKALGTLSGDLNSSVFSGLYTITPPVVPVVQGTNFSFSGKVTIP